MTKQVLRFPIYLKIMGWLGAVFTLVQLLVIIHLFGEYFPPSASEVNKLVLLSACIVVSAISSVSLIFARRAAYSSLFFQVAICAVLLYFTFQAATNADYFAVGIIGIVGIVCLLAFMITGIFYHPVREWLRHGKNDNVVPYDWRMIRLYSYVLIGFPLSVYIVGGLAGRSATLLPREIEYHSRFEKDPRLLLDDEQAT